MCGSSSACQKRRNDRNARLTTPSCGRHDVRGRWRRSVDDPHPKPLRPVPPAQSRAFCYAQADRPYREGPSRCAVCRQHARNAETAATHASKAPCDAIMLRSSSPVRSLPQLSVGDARCGRFCVSDLLTMNRTCRWAFSTRSIRLYPSEQARANGWGAT